MRKSRLDLFLSQFYAVVAWHAHCYSSQRVSLLISSYFLPPAIYFLTLEEEEKKTFCGQRKINNARETKMGCEEEEKIERGNVNAFRPWEHKRRERESNFPLGDSVHSAQLAQTLIWDLVEAPRGGNSTGRNRRLCLAEKLLLCPLVIREIKYNRSLLLSII